MDEYKGVWNTLQPVENQTDKNVFHFGRRRVGKRDDLQGTIQWKVK